ncbi:MAG: hypothetical protein M3M85_02755 [bacterium]|nr:hypothetical protein [bacterium]
MFQILFIFILGVVAGGFLVTLRGRKAEHSSVVEEEWVRRFEPTAPEPKAARRRRSPVGVVAQQKEKKDANMQAILGAFAWAQEGKVTTADVEKMLGVSESTAMRYLDELEKEGSIRKEISEDRKSFYLKLS